MGPEGTAGDTVMGRIDLFKPQEFNPEMMAYLVQNWRMLEDLLNGHISSDNIDTEGVAGINIEDGTITQPKLVSASLDGTIAKVLANAAVIAGIGLVYRLDIADATGDTDVTLMHKFRVTRFDFLNTGIAAHATLDLVQLKNVGNAITDAVAKTATVNKLVTASTYDPSYVEIAAGTVMRVTAAKNTNVAGVAYIYGHRVT